MAAVDAFNNAGKSLPPIPPQIVDLCKRVSVYTAAHKGVSIRDSASVPDASNSVRSDSHEGALAGDITSVGRQARPSGRPVVEVCSLYHCRLSRSAHIFEWSRFPQATTGRRFINVFFFVSVGPLHSFPSRLKLTTLAMNDRVPGSCILTTRAVDLMQWVYSVPRHRQGGARVVHPCIKCVQMSPKCPWRRSNPRSGTTMAIITGLSLT